MFRIHSRAVVSVIAAALVCHSQSAEARSAPVNSHFKFNAQTTNTNFDFEVFSIPNFPIFSVTQIAPGPDGNMWFTIGAPTRPGLIVRVTPTGSFTKYVVPSFNAQPFGIAAGPDGNMWFAEPGTDKIGRITMAGEITEYNTPSHPSSPTWITASPRGLAGGLWYTETSRNLIGHVAVNGAIEEFKVNLETNDQLGRLTSGADGNIWFSTERGIIGRITPSGKVTQFVVGSFAFGITHAPDRNVWFTGGTFSPPTGFVGEISPAGALREFNIPFIGSGNQAGEIASTSQWLYSDIIGQPGFFRISAAGEAEQIPQPPGFFPSSIATGVDGNSIWSIDIDQGKLVHLKPR